MAEEKKPRLRLPRRGTVFRIITWSTLVIAALLVVGAGILYHEATERFNVRRVSLPTLVFADSVPLREGAAFSAEQLESKLRRLGYRSTGAADESGSYAREGNQFSIFLRGFEHPEISQEPHPVEVATSGDRIASVSRPQGGSGPSALEPELLTSILTDRLESRSPVTLEQVPQDLVDAVVASEDNRFFSHPGVDPIGIGRALYQNLRSGGRTEGASTLTQQLVKNYYLTSERTYRRKILEAFMALILDAKYSKNEIMTAYLNDIYLGRDNSISIIGVGKASRFYFGKPVSEVDLAEAALLAGIIPSPNNYSPFTDPEAAKRRRQRVLDRMLDEEMITAEEHEEASNAPLPEEPTRSRSGLESVPYFVDAVLAELERYGVDDPEGRGLSIYTTMDIEWQDQATKTLQSHLENMYKRSSRIRNRAEPIQGALVAVDVDSGEVRALVGGRDYQKSQFNRALSARRQVGSLYKPFVLLAAFEPSLSQQNITPATRVKDEKFTLKRRFARDWSPGNYDGVYMGEVTVRQALEHSLNAASVRIGLAAGVDSTIRAARALGVRQDLNDNPALILGAADITPMEMAEAYTTIARMGARKPIHTIRFVTDREGDVVIRANIQSRQVFPERDVYLLVNVMEGVVDRGTAAGIRSAGFRKAAAGKTGTTNDKRDAWFVGFTPDTLALTWVGFDDNQPMGLSGSEAALPIWIDFMKSVAEDQPDREFPVPRGITFAEIDRTTGQVATEHCPPRFVIEEAFKSGTAPTLLCQEHLIPEPELLEPVFPEWGDIFGDDEPRDRPLLDGGIFREGARPDREQPPLGGVQRNGVDRQEPELRRQEPRLRERDPLPPRPVRPDAQPLPSREEPSPEQEEPPQQDPPADDEPQQQPSDPDEPTSR